MKKINYLISVFAFSSFNLTILIYAINIITYEVTQSETIVSANSLLIAIPPVILGLFTGIIIDATSRKLFIYLEYIAVFVLSIILFLLFENNILNYYLIILYLVVYKVFNSLSLGSVNSILYDLSTPNTLSKNISSKSISMTLGLLLSSFVLSLFVSFESWLFVLSSAVYFVSFIIFSKIKYEDKNEKTEFNSTKHFFLFIIKKSTDFFVFVNKNKKLRLLVFIPFCKTFFVYWPLAIGILLKIGIESPENKKIYLISIVIMRIADIITSYILGNVVKKYHINHFFIGIAITGLGLFLFALSDNLYIFIPCLAIFYIGLTVSQLAYNFILQSELVNDNRTHGLLIFTIPYYFADICSSIVFTFLLLYMSKANILIICGISLMLLGCYLVKVRSLQ